LVTEIEMLNVVLYIQCAEIEDTTPPTLTVPEDIIEKTISPDGAQVTYTVTAEDK